MHDITMAESVNMVRTGAEANPKSDFEKEMMMLMKETKKQNRELKEELASMRGKINQMTVPQRKEFVSLLRMNVGQAQQISVKKAE